MNTGIERKAENIRTMIHAPKTSVNDEWLTKSRREPANRTGAIARVVAQCLNGNVVFIWMTNCIAANRSVNKNLLFPD